MIRGYLAGATLARTGDELSGPALLLLGLQHGAHAGSALLAGLTAAAAVGGPVFGALLDRSPAPGRLLATALAGYAGGLAVVATAFGHLPLVSVVAIAVVTGLLNPAIAGGWTAQLPAVAGPRLQNASRLDALTFTAAALAGPGLAGLLGGTSGLALAVVLVAVATPIAWHLPRKRPRKKTRLRDGFTVLVRNAPLRRATTASTISCAGIGMVTVCYPLLGAAHLRGPEDGALLLTVLAVTSLLANAVFTRRPLPWSPDRTVRLSTLVLAASAALAAVGTDTVSLAAAAAIAGIAEGPQLTALFAIRHREAPEHVRAQVFTTAASVKITGLAAGAALAGPLAAWSLPACLLTAAGVQLGAAAAGSRRSERHRLRAPLDLGAVVGAQGVDRGVAGQRLVLRVEPPQHLGAGEAGVLQHRQQSGQPFHRCRTGQEVGGHAQVAVAADGEQLPVPQQLPHLVHGLAHCLAHLCQRKHGDVRPEHVISDWNRTHS